MSWVLLVWFNFLVEMFQLKLFDRPSEGVQVTDQHFRVVVGCKLVALLKKCGRRDVIEALGVETL